VKIEYDG